MKRASLRIVTYLAGCLQLLAAGCGDEGSCGDQLVTAAEECDDGNTVAGDGCSPGCAIEEGWECRPAVNFGSSCEPICGDALLVSAEVCDPGLAEFGGYCAPDCRSVSGSCGDGVFQIRAEECEATTLGCRTDCTSGLGYECSLNVCEGGPSLDPERLLISLDNEERITLCLFLTRVAGGPGTTQRCDGTSLVVNSIEACVASLFESTPPPTGCRVGAFEQWVANFPDECALLQATTSPEGC